MLILRLSLAVCNGYMRVCMYGPAGREEGPTSWLIGVFIV